MNQTLNVPAQSVWCLAILPNGDIAAGCSDHRVYIFSNDTKRIADDDRLVSTIMGKLYKSGKMKMINEFNLTDN